METFIWDCSAESWKNSPRSNPALGTGRTDAIHQPHYQRRDRMQDFSCGSSWRSHCVGAAIAGAKDSICCATSRKRRCKRRGRRALAKSSSLSLLAFIATSEGSNNTATVKRRLQTVSENNTTTRRRNRCFTIVAAILALIIIGAGVAFHVLQNERSATVQGQR